MPRLFYHGLSAEKIVIISPAEVSSHSGNHQP